MTNTNSNTIEIGAKRNQKKHRILKQPYRIAGKIIIVLDEGLMKTLKIDDENIWFEQIALENGIMLKIMKCLI